LKDFDIVVTQRDFDTALAEVKPMFGIDETDVASCIRNGIIKYSPEVERVLSTGQLFINQVRNSDRTPLVSVLFEGK
jgi:vesicle-fusing ATPase